MRAELLTDILMHFGRAQRGETRNSFVWLLVRCSTIFVASALICFFSEAAAACGVSSKPTRDGRSQWYCASGAATVMVFVHGLNSNNLDAWTNEGDGAGNEVFWPDLVKSDPLIAASSAKKESPAILLASFHTGPGSRGFRIADAQKQLSDALFSSIDGQPPAVEKEMVILIGHSLGGVLLRDMLSRNAERFQGKKVGLLLVASPSKGSGFANVARFAQWAIDNRMVKELEQGSSYLGDVHERFSASIREGGNLHFLVGRELYEHLGLLEARARCTSNRLSIPGMFCAAGQRVASFIEGGPVVPRESAVVYWPGTARLVPESEHSSIARPTDSSHPTHQALRELVSATQQASVTHCAPPRNLHLTFTVQTKGRRCVTPETDGTVPSFELVQLSTDDGMTLRSGLPLSYDPNAQTYRVRIAEPPFPCPNQLFWGKLVPTLRTSRHETGGGCLTEVCFRRSRAVPTSHFALFDCVPGESCLPKQNAGIAVACSERDRTSIMVRLPEGVKAPHWSSPSLEALEKMAPADRPGFTEFYVVSEPLRRMWDVTSFAYAVFVNDSPVWFDGVAPFAERRSIGIGARVHLSFPIENLGFRGGSAGDGYEDIRIEIKFFNGDIAVGTATLRRRYVAYRHGAVIRETDLETGEEFSWRAIYRPATSGRNFEVMLEHGGTAEWMKTRRAHLDQLRKSYKGQPVVGVLRPGRAENSRIGMILGLEQDTGQVRSLYTRQEAEEICRWVVAQAEFNQLQKEQSYIFEFPQETFDDFRDRGRRVIHCAKL